MNRKLWEKFDVQTERCYGENFCIMSDEDCWGKAYTILKRILKEGRDEQPGFAPELHILDDITDFRYDVMGWLEEYMNHLDEEDDYETLLKVCDELLFMFAWEKCSVSDLYCRRVTALAAMGRRGEAAAFCENWLAKSADDMQAVAACVYAQLAVGRVDDAKALIEQYISEGTVCTDKNDVVFFAARKTYDVLGDKKNRRRVDRILEAYLEESMVEFMDEEGELPFN